MDKLKSFIEKNFESFTFYYRQLRYRVFVTVALSIAVGILDGFGLSMFMPLLQMVSGAEQVTGESMGKLGFLIDWLRGLGISLDLISVLLVMVVFFMFKGLAVFINSSYRVIVRNYFIKKLRTEMLRAFNHLTYKHFVLSDVGRIQNTMSGEVERVSRSFKDYFRAAEQGILVVVYMSFAFFVDPQFALLVTLGGWLTNFFYKLIYKRTKGTSKKFTRDSHGYQGQIIQHVANFKYLKATNLLKHYGGHLMESIEKIEKSRQRMGVLNAVVQAVREPMLIIIVATVIVIQAKVLNAPLGPVLVSLLFFYRALTALMSMQNSWNNFLEVSGSLTNVMNFQEELKQKRDEFGRKPFTRLKRGIEIHDGFFSYENEPVLKDINLKIEKNRTIAFVGESGSGKTTLVNILAGLMPLDKGDHFIDGIERDKLNIQTYQNRVGYITQEPVIFNDTIFNNVTFWEEKNEESLARFEMAMSKAAILCFLESLPLREETILGNNGVNLSGGQKQRISIARELYKDIDVLIMDEATSALDTETEKSIQESIEELKGEYTILIVAHRLSTIKNADEIVMMSHGEIVKVNSFEKLLISESSFRKMVELQEI